MIYKNVSGQYIGVYAYDGTDGTPVTGDAANITAYIRLDQGTPAGTNDTNPTEVDATNMPGWYEFALTQGETNAERLTLAPKSGTADVVIDQVQVFTQAAPVPTTTQIQSSAAAALTAYDPPTHAELTAATSPLATTTALQTVDDNVDAIKAKTDNLPSDPAGQSAVEAAITAATSPLSTFDHMSDDVTVGTNSDKTGYSLHADYDPAKAAASQTSVDDLPTNAELANALAGLSIPALLDIVDGVLKRGVAHVEDTAEEGSLAEMLLGAFESETTGTTWLIRKTAGGTFNVRTLTLDSDADPITGVTDA